MKSLALPRPVCFVLLVVSLFSLSLHQASRNAWKCSFFPPLGSLSHAHRQKLSFAKVGEYGKGPLPYFAISLYIAAIHAMILKGNTEKDRAYE